MIAAAEFLILYTFKNLVLFLSVLCSKVQMVVLAGGVFLIWNIWLETWIVKGAFTDASLYVRCAEAAVLVAGNILLYRVGKRRRYFC